MKLRSLVLPGLLAVIAVALLRAVSTRQGVGPIEYLTVGLLEVMLVSSAFRLSRHAIRGVDQ